MHQPYKGSSRAEQVGGFALARVLNVTFQKVQCEAALRAVAVFLCSPCLGIPGLFLAAQAPLASELVECLYLALAIVGFIVSCVRPHP